MPQLLNLNIVIASSLWLLLYQLEESHMKAGQGQMDNESKHLTLHFPPQPTPLQSPDEVSQQYQVNTEANRQDVNRFVDSSGSVDDSYIYGTQCKC